MYRKSWDVKEFIGQYAQVRLVDKRDFRWGHINFDDLKGDIICPHYLYEDNWRECKGKGLSVFQVFYREPPYDYTVRLNNFWYYVLLLYSTYFVLA